MTIKQLCSALALSLCSVLMGCDRASMDAGCFMCSPSPASVPGMNIAVTYQGQEYFFNEEGDKSGFELLDLAYEGSSTVVVSHLTLRGTASPSIAVGDELDLSQPLRVKVVSQDETSSRHYTLSADVDKDGQMLFTDRAESSCDADSQLTWGNLRLQSGSVSANTPVTSTHCIYYDDTLWTAPIGWKWDGNTGDTEWALYPRITYGWTPTSVGADAEHFPIALSESAFLTANYEAETYAGFSKEHNPFTLSAWITDSMEGPDANALYKVVVWDNVKGFELEQSYQGQLTGGFHTYNVYVDEITDSSGQAWREVNLVLTKERLWDSIPIGELLERLMEEGYLDAAGYVAGIELSAKPVSEAGYIVVHSLEVNRQSPHTMAGKYVPGAYIGGRFQNDGALIRHGWPGAYFEGRFNGPSVGIDFGSGGEGRYAITVDDQYPPIVVTPKPGIFWVDDLGEGFHKIQVKQKSGALTAADEFAGFVAGAETQLLQPRAHYSRQIEFWGDASLLGVNENPEGECAQEDAADTDESFAVNTAHRLRADYHINAIPDVALVRSSAAVEPFLSYLDRALPSDPFSNWEWPKIWNPDIVVIAVGSGDFVTPVGTPESWTDQTLRQAFQESYVDLLEKLRFQYGSSTVFILAAGELSAGSHYPEAVQAVVAQQNEAGFSSVHFWDHGPIGRPGCATYLPRNEHYQLAKNLADFILSL